MGGGREGRKPAQGRGGWGEGRVGKRWVGWGGGRAGGKGD